MDALIEAGILRPATDGSMTIGDVRRTTMVGSLLDAGLPLDGISAALRAGMVSLGFADSPEYERFAALSHDTFASVGQRTGIPLGLLQVIREAIGGGAAEPSSLMRDDELAVVPFIELQLRLGFRQPAIERLLRAMGDGLHRLAEAEAEWFRSEVIEPRLASGGAAEIGNVDPEQGLSQLEERALLAIYRSQQAQTWTSNIVAGFEYLLRQAGLYHGPDRSPAICFLDITGYTRLTQERGDRAAAELAERLAASVKRISIEHGGRPVKWLGDGVMCFFRDPGEGVVAALEMVRELAAAGFPPAHVGLHAGPVVVQQGDYFGQTVNMASRIADYARPGEVLVSQAIVEAAATASVAFVDIGDVELKGVAGTVRLHAARTAGPG